MRELARYGAVVLLYIALSFHTKSYLTWTMGPIFFVVMLEVVPRSYARIRRLRPMRMRSVAPPEAAAEAVHDR